MINKADEMVEAMLQSASFDEDAGYIQRGRPNSGDADDTLNARWIGSFKGLAAGRSDEQVRILGDCNAEMRRRNLEPPVDQVAAEMTRLREEIRQNPHDPGVLQAIAEFMWKRENPDA
jgi:hypothetical protein